MKVFVVILENKIKIAKKYLSKMGPAELKMMLKAQGLLLIFLVAFGGDVGVSGQIVAEKIPLGELKNYHFFLSCHLNDFASPSSVSMLPFI